MLNLTELIGFGVGGAAAHRFWRLKQTTAAQLYIAEVAMRATQGGTDLTVGTSGAIGSAGWIGSPTQAFDGGTNMFMTNSGYGWVGYDFGTPVALVEVELVVYQDYAVWPTIQVEFSDNGTDWYPAAHDPLYFYDATISQGQCYEDGFGMLICTPNSFGITSSGYNAPWAVIRF